jgi:hypothetical protein
MVGWRGDNADVNACQVVAASALHSHTPQRKGKIKVFKAKMRRLSTMTLVMTARKEQLFKRKSISAQPPYLDSPAPRCTA